ncbi:hypothetical protein ACP70R_011941 [Stipagrostis hirtigluma subsp. patula]
MLWEGAKAPEMQAEERGAAKGMEPARAKEAMQMAAAVARAKEAMQTATAVADIREDDICLPSS